jgi:flagella basal body P-ring formation protein FlgA
MKRMRKYGLVVILFILVALVADGNAQQNVAVFHGTQIRSKIEKYIQSCYTGWGIPYQVEWVKPVPDVRLLNKPDSIEVSHRSQSLPVGNEVVKVTFYQGNTAMRSLYVSLKIHVFRKVWVTNEPVRRDQKLERTSLKLEEHDISVLHGNLLDESENIDNLIACRTLSAGEIIRQNDVRQPYAVRKGEGIMLQYIKGPVRMKMAMNAMQNGGRGDMIWVRNPKTRTRMKVKISGPGMAVLP